MSARDDNKGRPPADSIGNDPLAGRKTSKNVKNLKEKKKEKWIRPKRFWTVDLKFFLTPLVQKRHKQLFLIKNDTFCKTEVFEKQQNTYSSISLFYTKIKHGWHFYHKILWCQVYWGQKLSTAGIFNIKYHDFRYTGVRN